MVSYRVSSKQICHLNNIPDAEWHEIKLSSALPATDDDTVGQPGLLDIGLHEYRLLKGSEESRMFSLGLDEFCDAFGS